MSAMTISLPKQKLSVIQRTASQLLQQTKVSAWELAQLLGMLVAAHQAVLPASLHYRAVEGAKRRALQGYESQMSLDGETRQDPSCGGPKQ